MSIISKNHNIALLVPITSKKCGWSSIDQSYLKNRLLTTLFRTVPSEYKYKFYFGIDPDESIYTKEGVQKLFDQMLDKYDQFASQVSYDITVYHDIEDSHITRMWNILYEKAYKTYEHDYYYQCGDDTELFNKGWLEEAIKQLQEMDDLGIVGPSVIQGGAVFRILTQVVISNKHYEIFGFLFPEQIKNWWCDDWINSVYQPDYVHFLKKHICENISCKEPCQARYVIKNIENEHLRYLPEHKLLVEKYLSK